MSETPAWAPLQASLPQWVADRLGIDVSSVYWQRIPRGFEPDVFAVVSRVAYTAIGVDGNRKSVDPVTGAITFTTSGQRRLSVNIRVFAPSMRNDLDVDATAYGSRLFDSALSLESLAQLKAAGLAIIELERLLDLTELHDLHEMSVCSVDIKFGMASNRPQRAVYTFIESAEVQLELDNPDGSINDAASGDDIYP